ncbi:MAG: tripartite tricarboxylate transporter substrate binding protein [Acetobacteraceae bacterium]|nr:tripartite tricarboxylate transporter substrate binding protein [Acetobacteraceae bacterium]
MTPTRRIILATPALLAAFPGARAQERWSPRGPVRFVVTFAAGGSADLLARRLAGPLGEQLGQTVVVDNRPGAGGNIGMDAVAKAAPDGQTIGMGAAGPMAINPALQPGRMPFDAARDFTPLIHLADQANVLLTAASVPAAPIGAFRDWLRAQRDEPFGSPGNGTSNHLTGLAFGQALGARLVHVPYRGSAPAHADILSGNIRLMVDNIATALPFLRDGRMKAALVSTAQRSRLLPEVPSLPEAGGPPLASWQGMFAPANLPAPIAARLNEALNAALARPEVGDWLRDSGAEAVGGPAQRFADFLAAERPRWAQIVRENNVQAD